MNLEDVIDWNKLGMENKYCMISLICKSTVELLKAKSKSRTGWEAGKIGEMLVKSLQSSSYSESKSCGDLMDSIVTKVNNTVLYPWNWLRKKIQNVLTITTTGKNVAM